MLDIVGPLTIERHADLKRRGVHLRVFVRGEDVTDRCKFADDTPGHELAFLYRQNDQGWFYPDEDGLASVEIAEEDIVIGELSS